MKYRGHKYGAKKAEKYGKKFDSQLELYFYEKLIALGITFEFQRKEVLQGKFRHNDKAVREITMFVDFVIHDTNKIYFIDTKGFFTEVAKIKYKMLTHKYFNISPCGSNKDFEIIFIKNKKEADGMGLWIKEELRKEGKKDMVK